MGHLLVVLEAARCQGHELGNGGEVPIGIRYFVVSEVRGELADPSVDILTISLQKYDEVHESSYSLAN